MELRQLEYLVAVVEEASFTRAAERLHVAQPGVSAQIRRLEAELGQALLDRAGGVRPTEAGAAVLPHARAALAAVAAVRQAVDEVAGLLRGRASMGVVTSYGAPDVPALLASFRRRHPGVDISLTEGGSERLIDGLRDGALDLALVSLPATEPAGLETRVVSDEAFVAAVAHTQPLARRRTIALRALREEPLICLPHGTGLRSRLEAACAGLGFRPHVAFEAGDPGVLAQLAARGLGVAILPESLAAGRARDLHAIAITQPALRGALVLAWRAGGPTSPAGRALVEHALAGVEEPLSQR
jgi:DNA-binding transcriptional LysR family regulator